jgi:hypothetical protein
MWRLCCLRHWIFPREAQEQAGQAFAESQTQQGGQMAFSIKDNRGIFRSHLLPHHHMWIHTGDVAAMTNGVLPEESSWSHAHRLLSSFHPSSCSRKSSTYFSRHYPHHKIFLEGTRTASHFAQLFPAEFLGIPVSLLTYVLWEFMFC